MTKVQNLIKNINNKRDKVKGCINTMPCALNLMNEIWKYFVLTWMNKYKKLLKKSNYERICGVTKWVEFSTQRTNLTFKEKVCYILLSLTNERIDTWTNYLKYSNNQIRKTYYFHGIALDLLNSLFKVCTYFKRAN